MKLLFLIVKSRRYWSDEVLKDFNITEEFNNKQGANRITLGGYIIDKYKDELEVFRPVIKNKFTGDEYIELEAFRKKCKEVDRILFLTPTPINSVATHYHQILFFNIAFEFKEKIRLVVDDAFDIHTLKKSLTLPNKFWNEFNQARYKNDLKAIKDYIEGLKYIYYNSKKLIHVLYNHSEEEIKECYGEIFNTIYSGNIFYQYPKPPENIKPISDRSSELKYAALSPQRSLENNKAYLKYYNIKDVTFIGVQGYKSLHKPEALTEQEIFNELKDSKFILALPIKKASLTWERRRIVYAMLLNAVLIPFGKDAEYLGKPFIVSKDILSKSDEELQEIANEQRDYFYSRLLTEQEIKNNFDNWLK